MPGTVLAADGAALLGGLAAELLLDKSKSLHSCSAAGQNVKFKP